MEQKPPCPFTLEELEDSERGMLARYRKRFRNRDPKTVAAVAQGRVKAMARVVPPELWATDPAVTGQAVEGPTRTSTATLPGPDDSGPAGPSR
jgi:hypothetical protein